jgi:hypothetical protein
MNNFGALKGLKAILKESVDIESKDLLSTPQEDRDEEIAEDMENISVKELPDDKFGKKVSGAAGNPTEKDKAEAQFGGIGLGGGLKGISKDLHKGLSESFEKMNEIVDDSAMEMHNENKAENSKEVVRNKFNIMFDNKFGKAHEKKYDLDATKPFVSYTK